MYERYLDILCQNCFLVGKWPKCDFICVHLKLDFIYFFTINFILLGIYQLMDVHLLILVTLIKDWIVMWLFNYLFVSNR